MSTKIPEHEIDYAAASETMGPAPPRGARRRSGEVFPGASPRIGDAEGMGAAEALAGAPAVQSGGLSPDAAAAYDLYGDPRVNGAGLFRPERG